MTFSFDVIAQAVPILLHGAWLTLKIAVISLIIAFIIGLIAGLMGTSSKKIVRGISNVYVEIFRGTPLLVQIFFIYFGLPVLMDIRIPAETAGVIAVSLNAGAYISEVVRAGIISISKGQTEAARSLGLSHFLTMRLVILPQALRRMIPAFVNQFIISLKDTSLLSVIGIGELTQRGEIIVASTYRSFEIWATVGVFYFVMIFTLSRVSRLLERRLDSK